MTELVKNLTQQQKILTEKINVFNDEYAHYVRCKGNTAGLKVNRPQDSSVTSPPPSIYPNLTDSNYCQVYDAKYTVSGGDPLDDLKSKYADVLTEINNGNAIIQDIIATQNPNNYSEIVNTYKKNLHLRNELDLKLKEIYEEDGTTQRNLKIDYDSTVYASIAWSVLATSLIYYVFVKL